jgi:hypothetical protein
MMVLELSSGEDTLVVVGACAEQAWSKHYETPPVVTDGLEFGY